MPHVSTAKCTQRKPKHRLTSVDRKHKVNVNRYLVAEVTLADLRYNASLLGLSHREFVLDAEKKGFAHDYDQDLKEADTQEARYLLLKKLYDNDLVQTGVYVRLVQDLTHHCENESERLSLRHALSFCPHSRNYVETFCEPSVMRKILVC